MKRTKHYRKVISKILGLIQNAGLNKQQEIIDLCNKALERNKYEPTKTNQS